MMKNYRTTRTFARSKKPNGDSSGKATIPFPEEKVVMSFYSGPNPHESRRKLKLTSQAINAVSTTVLEYLRWSEFLITFDQTDHPNSIPKPGRFPLIVDLLVRTTWLTNALMDGGSGLNLMYLDTFEGLGLTRDQLQSSRHPLYVVVSGKQSVPLGRVTLLVTFRDMSNYHIETPTFELVDFSGPYHVISGWPCYVKFMAIPSYTYLKLKIPRPAGVITVEAKTWQALNCQQDSIELVVAAVAAAKLWELSLWLPTIPLSLDMPPTSSIFKMDEDAKAVQIDAGNPTKTMQIGVSLNPK
jgi:hypothetical protein